MKENILRFFIEDEEIKEIENAFIKDRRHPVKQLLQPRDRDKQVLINTNTALNWIIKNNNLWLESVRQRLVNTDDFSASSSALGEIRAYGYLLAADLEVLPIPETDISTPDFEVIQDKEKVLVEVHSKQYDGKEAKNLEKFNNESFTIDSTKRVTIREHVVTPFGKPGSKENISENVISRLASIKSKETQFSATLPSILWLDFQDEMWDLTVNADGVNPISTWNGELFAGEIWYAFYGIKGSPIFEGHSTEERAVQEIIKMRHNGRFNNYSKIDGVVFSFPRLTFAIENPYSSKSIPGWFWKNFIKIPWFHLEYSRLNWPDKNLLQLIKLETDKIMAFGKIPLYKW